MLRPELGSGPLDSPIHVIGRDYGHQEFLAQRPFVGPAGNVLDSALRAAGVERASVRVDNLVPKQPRGNDFAAHSIADVAWGQGRLGALLRTHKPKLIVALGNEVGRFLLGDSWPEGEGIQDLRGYLWDTAFGRVLTAVHPAAVLRDWTPWRALLDLDLRRAVLEVRNGCPPLDERDVTIVTAPRNLRELDDAMATGVSVESARGDKVFAAAQDQRGGLVGSCARQHRSSVYDMSRTRSARQQVLQWLAVDIENTHDLQLACVGLAPSPSRAWVIPAGEPWQLDAIRRLCESSVPKVLQNGQYDRFFLRRFAGIELRSQVFDTMLAWHALQPELAGKKTQTKRRAAGRRSAKSLNFLASIYTRDPFWKCMPLETRVLTADLRWVALGDVRADDALLGFDEYPYKGRKRRWRRSVVRAVSSPITRQCLRLVTEHGELVVGKEHGLLSRDIGGRTQWRRADELRVGVTLRRAFDTWTFDQSRNAGWLAGMFDGEGSIGFSKVGHTGWFVTLAQKHGPVLSAVVAELSARGISCSVYDKGAGVAQMLVLSPNTYRVLGQLRPMRLLSRFQYVLENHTMQFVAPSSKIVAIEDAGEREVVDIATDSKTFVAEGYAVHNSYNFTSDDERYVLCGKDCCVTLDIALKQARQLDTA